MSMPRFQARSRLSHALRRIGAGTLAAALACTALVALPSTASAKPNWCPEYVDVHCQNGVRVSGPPSEAPGVARCGASLFGSVCVRYHGDYVYVHDKWKDGFSVLGSVYSPGGLIRWRHCRNGHGSGTWVRCNFNWDEKILKTVYTNEMNNGDFYKPSYRWQFANN